jgi:hypothetical protein
MRFILGLILGVLLVIGGAYIHDNTDSGATRPLVYWGNASEVEHDTFNYLRTQFDRLVSWVTSSTH